MTRAMYKGGPSTDTVIPGFLTVSSTDAVPASGSGSQGLQAST
jgi:hypothetical protein